MPPQHFARDSRLEAARHSFRSFDEFRVLFRRVDAVGCAGHFQNVYRHPVVEGPQTIETAMSAGTAPVVRCGERLARLVSIGLPRTSA